MWNVSHTTMRYFVHILLFFGGLLALVGCRDTRPRMLGFSGGDGVDSVAFARTHHYWKNYNFLTTDSIRLSASDPSGVLGAYGSDSVQLGASDAIVVANIANVPTDSIDSTWVMVARDAETMGWVRESDLLPNVVPDQFITRFIHAFSLGRTWVVLSFAVLALGFLVFQNFRRGRLQMVHYNDIKSFYPTLLCLVVSSSAVLYGALQQFAPELWQEFYFHPTLNPFASVAWPLRFFLLSLWAMAVLGIAVVDDVRKLPGVVDDVAYLGILAGVCMVLYFFFSLSVHIYVGYPLLLAYWIFALRRHFRFTSAPYRCARCGEALHAKGRCPSCGAIND